MSPAHESIAAAPTACPAFSPRLAFAFLTLFALLGQTVFPRVREAFGVSEQGKWFLDSHAVLASSDAARAGIEPDAPNPYDVFQRSHKYSDWWFVLGRVGLTRADNFLLGGLWVLAFLVAALVTLRPRSHAEAVWMAVLVASPPVMLAIIRANNDLVVFALLAIAVVALRGDSATRIAVAIAALALATGLKFYPVAAAGVLLLIPGRRRMAVTAGAGAVVLVAVLVSVWPQIARGTFHIEPQIHTFGSRIVLHHLGAGSAMAAAGSAALFALLALALARARLRPGSEAITAPDEARMMAVAAGLLVVCFVAGTNYAYRMVFALWAAPWCWSHRREIPLARVGAWLLPLVLWHDGILCAATELWFPNLSADRYSRILDGWRYATEPLTWMLFGLFAGWWLQVASGLVGGILPRVRQPASDSRGTMVQEIRSGESQTAATASRPSPSGRNPDRS